MPKALRLGWLDLRRSPKKHARKRPHRRAVAALNLVAVISLLAGVLSSENMFAFAAGSTFTQSTYGWYSNADSLTPGGTLASQGSAASISDSTSAVRLRMNVGVGTATLNAGSQAFKLQQGTNTAGPWSDVSPWWNTSWGSRRKITIDNSASTEDLINFPLRVSLSSSNINYAKTQDSGQDIRFVDPDGTPLKYEIEQWNEAATSEVWVKVPQIDQGSTTDYVWMYYDNAAAADGQDKNNVWDSNYQGVYHLKDNPSTSASTNCAGGAGTYEVCDSTGVGNHGDSQGSMTAGSVVAGQIGSAITFDAVDDYFNMNSLANDVSGSAGTYSFWMYRSFANGAGSSAMFSLGGGGNNEMLFYYSGSSTAFKCLYTGNGSDAEVAIPQTVILQNTWANVACTWDRTANQLKAYVNGVQYGTTTTGLTTWSGSPTMAGMGAEPYNPATYRYLGRIDELKVSNTVRSAKWLQAEYKAGANTLNSFGAEELVGATPWRFADNASVTSGSTIAATSLSTSTVKESYTEYSPTALNPNAITVGGYGEWDFPLVPVALSADTPYYFRMVKSDGTALDTYSAYPTITLRTSLNQEAYRWFANADATSPGSQLAATNTAAVAPGQGTPFRLRMLLHANGTALNSGARSFKLQYATRSGACDTSFTGESYGDVLAGSGALRYYNNPTPADGATATTNANDPSAGHTRVFETYEEANNAATSASVPVGQDGLWDFSLIDFASGASTTYCFRMVESDGTVLNTYTAIPEIVTAQNAAPTSLAQFKTDTTTSIATSGWTSETAVAFRGVIVDVVNTNSDLLCVETQPIGTAFTGLPTDSSCSGSGVTAGNTVYVTVNSLPDGGQYHWQARTKDPSGNYSAWAQYGGNAESVADFKVDLTGPTTATVFDGTTVGVQTDYPTASLSTISANWNDFTDASSGIASYSYAVGTTSGGTNVVGWTSNGSAKSFTASSLDLRTSQKYYVSVRAYDTAGNVSAVATSPGQQKLPSFTFGISATSLDLGSLRASNSYTRTGSVTLTTSTNAYNGYTVTIKAADVPRNASNQALASTFAGTWASPTSWSSGTGLGYSSTDALVSGSNRFSYGTAYALMPTASADTVVDTPGTVHGTAISNEAFNVNFKTVSSATQSAGMYRATVTFNAIPTF